MMKEVRGLQVRRWCLSHTVANLTSDGPSPLDARGRGGGAHHRCRLERDLAPGGVKEGATPYCPTRNSMRRLRARPSSVLFDAIG